MIIMIIIITIIIIITTMTGEGKGLLLYHHHITHLLFTHSSAKPRRFMQISPLGEKPNPAPEVGINPGAFSTTLTRRPFFMKALAADRPPMPDKRTSCSK